jgi:hypothetical protein
MKTLDDAIASRSEASQQRVKKMADELIQTTDRILKQDEGKPQQETCKQGLSVQPEPEG